MFFKSQQLPKIGDEITIEGVKKTVVEIARNSANDPIVVWTSKHEEGGCMLSIWEEWAKYAKLGKPLPSRRSDIWE